QNLRRNVWFFNRPPNEVCSGPIQLCSTRRTDPNPLVLFCRRIFGGERRQQMGVWMPVESGSPRRLAPDPADDLKVLAGSLRYRRLSPSQWHHAPTTPLRVLLRREVFETPPLSMC